VVGADTGVGKTWVTARLLERARAQGLAVSVRKPVQSYDAAEVGATDAEVLAVAAGLEPTDVCPAERWYPLPMAPPMAADALGRPEIAMSDLGVTWPAGLDLALVETVGGVRSPVAHDGDSAALAALATPDRVLLVTDARLGTINATMLSLEALVSWPAGVFVNRFDPRDDLHRRNLAWLERHAGVAVDTTLDPALARCCSAVDGEERHS
jgi:dethiobiotin synthetase